MAQRTIVQLVSDLSGEELEDGQGRTVVFGYDGGEYSIDLTDEEVEQFDEMMAEYINAATRINRGRRTNRRSSKPAKDASPAAAYASPAKPDLASVREWARANGYEVSDRGRIKAEVMEAYQLASS